MPDPIVAPDAQPAASSAATVSTPAESISLDSLSETQLHDWRMTGELPDTQNPAPSAGTPPAEPVAQVASTDASIVAASEPAKPTKGADARIPELLADRAKERERAERAERRLAEIERQHQPTPDVKPAASSTAPAGLVKPDPEAFPYGTSDPAYLEALTDYKVAATLANERQQWEQRQQQARARDESHRVITAFEARTAEARVKHPDFDVVAMLAPTEIQPGSVADLMVLEDEAGAEILYHLQQPTNAAERRRILALGPREQFKELVLLGNRLTADPSVARSTNAPPPPPTLSTRATPADALERAMANDDDAAYIAEMNRRDLASRKR